MRKYIDINGLKISYTDSGLQHGDPIILMHGWGCNLSTVQSIADIFNNSHRVINVDLPGHGESSEPPNLPDGKPWGVEEYAQLIETLIYKLKLENPSFIGHSYGGRVAIILASRNQTDKLVLVDSAGIKPKRSFKYYIKVYSFKTAKKLLPMLLGKKLGDNLIDKWRGKAGSSDYRQASAMMRRIMSRSVNQDLKKYMPDIAAPTLLVWGENDTATPLSDAKTMEKLIPDAGLVVFRGCGHYSFLDNPAQFQAVMKSFFNV